MKLNDYLIKNEITTRSFAKKLGASYSAVCKWRIRNRFPKPRMMLKIQKATSGRVKITDWY